MSGQYPGEKEITVPPLTCLEADGEPRVEHTDQGEIIYFPLKVLPPLPHPAQHFMIRCKGTPAPMAAPHAHPCTPHDIRTQTKHPTHTTHTRTVTL